MLREEQMITFGICYVRFTAIKHLKKMSSSSVAFWQPSPVTCFSTFRCPFQLVVSIEFLEMSILISGVALLFLVLPYSLFGHSFRDLYNRFVPVISFCAKIFIEFSVFYFSCISIFNIFVYICVSYNTAYEYIFINLLYINFMT